jgi:hypothetical protein
VAAREHVFIQDQGWSIRSHSISERAGRRPANHLVLKLLVKQVGPGSLKERACRYFYAGGIVDSCVAGKNVS